MKIDSPSITGSFTTQNGLTGSLFGTASWAVQAITASYALTGGSGGGGSAFPFTGNAIITGSLVVTGSTTSTLGFTGSLLGTASFAQSASNAATASFLVNDRDTFTIVCSMGGTTLAANTIYYMGQGGYSANTTANRRNVFIPFTGTLTNATITAGTTSTTVTAADVAVAFRLNNTTDTSLGNVRFTGGNANANGTILAYNVTGLTTAVAAGDFFEIKFTTPVSYASPPAAASLTVHLYFTRTA
jgi:hypothetical protein